MNRLALIALLLSFPSRAQEPRRDRFRDPLPSGAVARLGTVNAHPNATAIVFSEDGRIIVTTSAGVARHWDVDSGRVRRVIAHPQRFEDVRRAVSADGRIAAIAFEDRVEVHELASGMVLHRVAIPRLKELAKTNAGPPPLAAFALSPRGDSIIARINGALEMLVIRDGRLEVWPGFDGEAGDPVFSQDGKWVAVRLRGEPGEIAFRNTARLAPVFKFTHDGPVHAIAPDGGLLLVGNAKSHKDWNKVRLVESRTGRLIPGSELSVGTAARAACFSSDGRLLAVAAERQVTVWDVAAKRLAWTVPGTASCLAFSPDVHRLAGVNHLLSLWDAATGKPIGPDFGPLPNHLPDNHSIRNGRVVLLNTLVSQLQVWELTSGRPSFVCGFEGNLSRIGAWLSGDGSRLYGYGGGTARAWDIGTGKLEREFNPMPADLAGGKWIVDSPPNPSPDGSTFQVLFFEGSFDDVKTRSALVKCDANSGKLLNRRELKLKAFRSAGIRRNGDAIWASDDRGDLHTYDAVTGQVRPAAKKLAIEGMEVNGPHYVTADGRLHTYQLIRDAFSRTGTVHDTAIVDTASGRLLGRMPCGLWQKVYDSGACSYYLDGLSKAISPDGRWLAIGKWSGVELWDLVEQEQIPFHQTHPTPDSAVFGPCTIESLAFVTNDRLLVQYGDMSALVWELPAATRVRALARVTATTWDELADEDPRTALRAAWAVKDDRAAGLALLRRLPRVPPPDEKRLAALFADLGSNTHATREAAMKQLREFGRAPEQFLAVAVAKSANAEQRRRAQQLLDRFVAGGPVGADERRAIRAVYAAELLGDTGRALLDDWAKGADSALLTREAKAALVRHP